jgi:formyltetrahydrofolate synthetase
VLHAANLADALRGSSAAVVAGSVTDAPIKARLGKIVALEHVKVSTVAVKDGATPLVSGTDYTVNEEAGSVKFASTITGVTDGDALTVSYSYAAQTKVDALTEGAKELYMRFEGLNTAEGNDPVVVEVFKFLTDPLKELALISDAIQQFTLEGSVLADPTKTTGSKFFNARKLN